MFLRLMSWDRSYLILGAVFDHLWFDFVDQNLLEPLGNVFLSMDKPLAVEIILPVFPLVKLDAGGVLPAGWFLLSCPYFSV